ncbi:hypothetical protein A1O3_03916, partial [Capronia epimyces CBS 606.96]
QGNINTAAPAGEQVAAWIKNIAAILKAAGSSLNKINKTTVFITDMRNFAEVNAVYAEAITHWRRGAASRSRNCRKTSPSRSNALLC